MGQEGTANSLVGGVDRVEGLAGDAVNKLVVDEQLENVANGHFCVGMVRAGRTREKGAKKTRRRAGIGCSQQRDTFTTRKQNSDTRAKRRTPHPHLSLFTE